MPLISGRPRPSRSSNTWPRPDLGQDRARARQVGRVEGAAQAAVDQHHPLDVAVAGAPAEVPGGVGRGGRGAQRVAAQDHLAPPARARREDHPAQVAERHLQAPAAGPGRVAHRLVLEAEVVVEGGLGVAALEHRGVLERVLAPVDDPHGQPGHARHDVARHRGDPARRRRRSRARARARASPRAGRSSARRRGRTWPGPAAGTPSSDVKRSAAAAGAAGSTTSTRSRARRLIEAQPTSARAPRPRAGRASARSRPW